MTMDGEKVDWIGEWIGSVDLVAIFSSEGESNGECLAYIHDVLVCTRLSRSRGGGQSQGHAPDFLTPSNYSMTTVPPAHCLGRACDC